MKKFILTTLVALITAMVSIVPAPTLADEKIYTLKFHYEQPTTAPLPVYGFEPWAKAVEKATQGKVKIQVFPGNTLFTTKTDAVEAVKAGIADIAFMYAWAFSPQFDLIDAGSIPFLAPNAEVASRAIWALYEKFPELQAQWKDVKLLSAWSTQP